jgi:hypothetical protein
MTKLVVVLRNFANAPKKSRHKFLGIARDTLARRDTQTGADTFLHIFAKKMWWINTCLVLQSKWCVLVEAAIGRKTKSGRRKRANAVATSEKWIYGYNHGKKPRRFVSFIAFCCVLRKGTNESCWLHYSYFWFIKFEGKNGVCVDWRRIKRVDWTCWNCMMDKTKVSLMCTSCQNTENKTTENRNKDWR